MFHVVKNDNPGSDIFELKTFIKQELNINDLNLVWDHLLSKYWFN